MTRFTARWLALGVLACLSVVATADSRFPEGTPIVPLPLGGKVILGEADFEQVISFKKGHPIQRLGRSIAHLSIGGFVCSGFLVGDDLLMTNEHCVNAGGKSHAPADVKVYMDYYKKDQRGALSAKGSQFLFVDKALDVALVKLDRALGDRYPVLKLSQDIPNGMTSVKIIQHPQGRQKEVSRRNSEVVALIENKNVIHYIADTQGGSSGSPVFALDGETVVALHHVGVRGKYNEGVLMAPIVQRIAHLLGLGGAAPQHPNWSRLLGYASAGQPLAITTNQPTYRLGEAIKIQLTLPDSGYLNVVSVSASGEVTVLFPNQYDQNNKVPTGNFSLPSANMPFELTAAPPAEKQLIVGFLSEEPFNLYADSPQAGKAVFASATPLQLARAAKSSGRSALFTGSTEIELAP